MKERVSRWHALLRLVAFGYPVVLLLVIVTFRFVGERWWPVAALLYLPRLGFALPLPLVILSTLAFWRPRLLALQSVSVLLLLFPLMGLCIFGGATPKPGAPSMRVFSYNVDSGRNGLPIILSQMRASKADVLVLQEALYGIDFEKLRSGMPGYHVHESGQFLVATRFPIVDVYEPPKVFANRVQRSPRFIRYQLATPHGRVHVYSIHPISPREGLDELRGEGLRAELRRGRLYNPDAPARLKANTALRRAHLQAIAEDAAKIRTPIIIAGDTNLPGLSWLLARWLGSFRDGFSAVGRGFGYTFPAPKHPWMRIDRIFVSDELRFLSFAVDPTPGSDHRAVIADVEFRSSP